MCKSVINYNTKDFICEWIDWLFQQSVAVYEDKLAYSCVPANVDNNINTITVLGFNSSRFDSNLFKQYFNHIGKSNAIALLAPYHH